MPNAECPMTNARLAPPAPLVPAAIAMVAGIVLGRYAPLPIGVWATAGIAAFLTAAITLRREHLRILTIAAIASTIIFASATWSALSYRRIPENHIVTFSGKGSVLATIRGRVVSNPRLRKAQTPYWQPDRTTFLLEADAIRSTEGTWLETTGTIRVKINEPVWDLSAGRQVELVGSLRRPRPPGNPGQHDWREADRYKGILVSFSVPCADGVTTLKEAGENLLSGLWRRARMTARRHLNGCGAEDDTVLLEALVLGERSPALRELNQIMVEAGIAHFLSISGLHLGIFLGFIYWLCRLLTFSPRRSAWVVLIILAGYVLLAEPRAPLLRSAIMASAICIAVISNRSVSTRNALAAAAIILLVIDPMQIFRAGFQLSFGIVAGILVLNRPIRQLLFGRWLRIRSLMVFRDEHRIRRWFYYRGADSLFSLVCMSLSAYISAAPLVAYHFGRFCPYAPALSILLLPMLVAVLVPAYVSMTLAFGMPNLAVLIGSLAAASAGAMRQLVMLTRHLPGLSIDLFAVPAWCVAGFYLAGGLWIVSRKSRVILSSAIVATLGLAASIVVTQLPATPPVNGRLHILDVAHGNMTLLHAPDGKTYLFDAGTLAPIDAYNQILRPFLRAKRLASPTAVFISHANIDHYNALASLLDRRPPKRVYLNEYFGLREEAAPDVRKLLDEFRKRDVQIIRLRAGQKVSLAGKTTVEILWPPPEGGTVKRNEVELGRDDATAKFPLRSNLTVPPVEVPELDINNCSLVLRVVCGGKSVIIPGDIGEPAETYLAKLPPEKIHADVLILPHHGSATPTLKTFIEAVHPEIIVQSSSYRPAPAELLEAIGERKRYATFRDGWIGLTLSMDKLDIETMRKTGGP